MDSNYYDKREAGDQNYRYPSGIKNRALEVFDHRFATGRWRQNTLRHIMEIDAATGAIRYVIEVGSNKAHRIEVLPDGSKLYTENEKDPFASVIDLAARKRVGTPSAWLLALPGPFSL